MTPKVQEDCVGITLQLKFVAADGVTPVPLTGSPTVQILLKDPVTGALATRTATVLNDGSTGTIEYVTTNLDLINVGSYKYQGKATWGSGQVLYTEVKKIKVKANLSA